MFQRIENKINFTKFKTWCSEVSFTGMKLEKIHTTQYLFCFQMSCVVFWNQKRVVRKKSLNTISLAAKSLNGAFCRFNRHNIKIILS